MEYKYYLTKRPPSIGTQPKDTTMIVAFDEKKEYDGIPCWGYVEYDRPLTEKELSDYELTRQRKVALQSTEHVPFLEKPEPRYRVVELNESGDITPLNKIVYRNLEKANYYINDLPYSKVFEYDDLVKMSTSVINIQNEDKTNMLHVTQNGENLYFKMDTSADLYNDVIQQLKDNKVSQFINIKNYGNLNGEQISEMKFAEFQQQENMLSVSVDLDKKILEIYTSDVKEIERTDKNTHIDVIKFDDVIEPERSQNSNEEAPEISDPVPLIDMEVNKEVDVEDILENLKNGVPNIFENENFVKYLDFQSKFHNYSANNSILINLQKPYASQVASFSKWKSLGRSVNKGEKGIVILAPKVAKLSASQVIDYLDKRNSIRISKYQVSKTSNGYTISSSGKIIKCNINSKELQNFLTVNKLQAQLITGFKKAYVFDVSQTNGKEIPQFKLNKLSDKDLLNDKGYYKMPYIKVHSSENNLFEDNKTLTLPKANDLFKKEENRIREKKIEFEKKGEYYPYNKVRFSLHLSPEQSIGMRYDIGDGYANDLCNFINKELGTDIEQLKNISQSIGLQNTEMLGWYEHVLNNKDNIMTASEDFLNSVDNSSENKFTVLLSRTDDIAIVPASNINEYTDMIEQGLCKSVVTMSAPLNVENLRDQIDDTLQDLKNSFIFEPETDSSMATILGLKNQIESCIDKNNLSLEYISDDKDSANGYFSPAEKKICVKNNMSLSQTVKTLIHEYVHSQIHVNGYDPNIAKDNMDIRNTAEIEAESSAYVVSKYFGFDTSEYSFNYVSSWARGREISELESTLSNIKNTSQKIIDEIKSPLELELYNTKENIVEMLTKENVSPRNDIVQGILELNCKTGKMNNTMDFNNYEKFKSFENDPELSKDISTLNSLIKSNVIVEEKNISIENER